MDNRALVKEMFTLQQKLNDQTNGEDWEKGYNKHGRIINWKRCIHMESAELIDSFNWKHWKDINIAPDWDNIKIELVDIWHFVMSLGLEYYKNNNLGDIDTIVDEVRDSKYFDDFCGDAQLTKDEDALIIVSTVEYLIRHVLEDKSFDVILDDFMVIALQCGLNMKILYKYYIGKNILNQFRQDNGYKEGTYKKTWNGVEDNVIMSELLDQDALSAKNLYDKLKQTYNL